MKSLADILAAHALWVLAGDDLDIADEASGEMADLSGQDLSGKDLRRAFLPVAKLRNVNLTKADLTGAIMPNGQIFDSTSPSLP